MIIETRVWTLDELIIADKVKLGRGNIISKKDIASFPGEFPIYSSAREKNGTFGYYGKYLFDEELITWSIDGGGRLFYRPRHKFSVTNVGGTLRILDTNFLDCRYLHLVLTHLHSKIRFDWVYKAHPSVIRMVYNEIPIPSLEEQRKIVEKLDSAIAEIEDAKMRSNAALQNLSKLLDSKFEEVFTILEAEFGVVQSCKIIDVRDGTHDSPSYVDSGYPLITSKNLQDGLIDFSKVSLITEEDYQQINKRSKVEVGDLLLAMIGTIGNPVVVKEGPLFAIKNVALFKGNPSYDMTFLSFYLRTTKIREKFEREAKGTTQRFLGLGYLRTLDIPNVPHENQLEIVRKLEQFESEIKRLELNLKKRLVNFIELNNSIVSSMFTIDSEEEAVA